MVFYRNPFEEQFKLYTEFKLINYKRNGKYKLTSNKNQPGSSFDWLFIPCLGKLQSEICLGVALIPNTVDLIQSFRTFGRVVVVHLSEQF